MNYMAENIFANLESEPVKSRLGRREAIEDGRLWNVRDQLNGLLESTWPYVGSKIPKIKKESDVIEALRHWEKDNKENLYYIVRLLLKNSSEHATAKSLNEQRRKIGELHKAYLLSFKELEKWTELLGTALRIDYSKHSEDEWLTIRDKTVERAEKLAHLANQYLRLQEQEQVMRTRLEACEAYFARNEFVAFCRSSRYRLTPLSIANALAGLPEIGWRQSAKRCRNAVCQGANGGAIQEFETIRKIVQSCTRKLELISYAERWLKAQGATKKHGPSTLQDDWYYLKLAIKAVLDSKVLPREMPFAIAREYRQKRYHPSNADLLFAHDERIIPESKHKKAGKL